MSEPGPSATASAVDCVPITYSRLLEELGRLSIMFNLMEMVVCHRTWELIGQRQRIGRTVTARLTFAQVADLLRDLYVVRYPEPGKKVHIRTVHAMLRGANDRRNDLLHTSWALMQGDPAKVGRAKARFSGAGLLSQMELKSAIGEVRNAINAIGKATNAATALLPSMVAIGDGSDAT